MTLLRHLLLQPLSPVYGMVVSLRNLLYDLGIFRSHSFPFPVICVGNITVGGTGKTPHVEYIAELISQSSPTAVLSRGYLRRSKGFRVVQPGDRASEAGDEPLQMALRLPGVRVAVDRDRVHGINELQRLFPEIEAILLDDGFQHRSVHAGLNILLTDYNRLMTRDRLLPYGRLRESVRGMKRADMIIVTKVPPEISRDETAIISKEIKPLAHQQLFFSTLEYGELKPVFHGIKDKRITKDTGVVLVTGIADPSPLAERISGAAGNIKHIQFSDHHNFNGGDILRIISALDALEQTDKIVVTTEKDSIRLKEFAIIADPLRELIYFLPVRVRFIENEEYFIKRVKEYAGKNNGDR
ncbi:MAG TPA: tetraacyldisaccharide 4'-kinase [Bacteroidales bacterium]|nr:tetraacyldisaccharide 4'-kinase [Bacteroidales bacterium]